MRKSSNSKSGRTSEPALSQSLTKLKSGTRSRSAGNSPASSPILGRNVQSKAKTSAIDILLDNTGNEKSETSMIDINGVSESDLTPECPNVNISKREVSNITKTQPHDGLKKCPCNSSDPESTYVKCAKCSQEWHNNCCNLSGISQNAIKKLVKWQCPKCYVCPLSDQSLSGDYKEFISTMSRIKKCNEELKDGVSSFEFFNQHIKHLLLDDHKYKNQSSKIDNLHADMAEVKTQLNLLMENMAKTPVVNPVPVLSPETETALKKLSTFPTEKISHIENQMSNLSTQVSTLEININNKDPLQTTVFHQQMEDFISKSTSDLSPKVKESIEKLANFPLEKINKIGDNLESLSGKFETFENHIPVNTPNTPSTRVTTGMEPNTCSPRLNSSPSPVNKIKPFTQYKDDAITPELKGSLCNLVQTKSNDFKTVGTDGSRDVLYFGEYSYRYTGGEHEAKEMPKEVDDLISHIRSQLPNPDMRTLTHALSVDIRQESTTSLHIEITNL